MKLKLREVLEHGHERERVVIDVLQDADLINYILTDTTYVSENTVSNKLRHMYWFVRQKVVKGDNVVLYTKKGKNSIIANANETTSYLYFWQLNINVWNETGDTAMLFELNGWNFLKAKP